MKILSILILMFSLLCVSSCAADKESYIVYMGAHSHGPEVTLEDYDRVTSNHHNFLASFLDSHQEAKDAIYHSYTRHINGFAAKLDKYQAAKIAKHPDVISVFPDKIKKIHTTHSWDFMMLEEGGKPSETWYATRFGEDTIIANLDTGVWPESKSFSDEGFGPIPNRWKGTCDEHVARHGHQVRCNKKLIGARHFNKGFKAIGLKLDKDMESARDYLGHGTHTLSTAAGNVVEHADLCGLELGTAKGGSPKARVASYKVCWEGGSCVDSDIMAGFDMAIHDGVDVISVSLGGGPMNYFDDSIAIGAFHAVQNGIVVVCSAGNSGPFPGTVANTAPWIITVAASTMDREFSTFVKLANGKTFKGTSLSKPLSERKLYPLISAAKAKLDNVSSYDALLCKPNTLDKKKVEGKILACLRGDTPRVDKGYRAKLAGAVGFILCNDESDGDDIVPDIHLLPAAHLNFKNGSAVFKYINTTKEPMGYIIGPSATYGVKPSPHMAAFSSVGPNLVNPEILKPDITAPGVNVLAAFSAAVSPTVLPPSMDPRKVTYSFESGTSMSCPHISGIAGLLKTLYPTWSPAAIRSAIMTTARIKDNRELVIEDGENEEASPLNYGAGHVTPNHVINPGLVYDITMNDYLNFLCANGYNKTMIKIFKAHKCSKEHSKSSSILDLNYPSITVANLTGSVTVHRKVKNVGAPGIYKSHIIEPAGVSVIVEPSTFKIKAGHEKKFKLTLTRKDDFNPNEYAFGELLWSDGEHHVRSPIVVSASQ